MITFCTLKIACTRGCRSTSARWSSWVVRSRLKPLSDISNGRDSASASTSIALISSSISPCFRSVWAFFSGRLFMMPSTRTTYSFRTSFAASIAGLVGSTTPCTIPERSRKSKKTIFPWSLRTSTQPEMDIVSPICFPSSPISVRCIKLVCHTNRAAHLLHFCFAHGASFYLPFREYFVHDARVVLEFFIFHAHRREITVEIFYQQFFEGFVIAVILGIYRIQLCFISDETMYLVYVLGPFT